MSERSKEIPKWIGWIFIGALTIFIMAMVPGFKSEYVLFSFVILSVGTIAFWGIAEKRKKPTTIVVPPPLSRSLTDVKTQVEELIERLGVFLVALDLSRFETSLSEMVVQTFAVIFYMYVGALSISTWVAPQIVPGSPEAMVILFVWLMALVFGMIFGQIYTSYVKSVSLWLGRRNVGKTLDRLARSLTLVNCALSSNEFGTENQINLILQSVRSAKDKLREKPAISRFRIYDLILSILALIPVASLAALWYGWFVSSTLKLFASLAVFNIILVIFFVFYFLPLLRVDGVLRKFGVLETRDLLWKKLLDLQSAVLGGEKLALIQDSFFFMGENTAKTIPKDVALQLCAEFQKEKGDKWFSGCWFCLKYSRGDPTKMAFSARPGHRGCHLVNASYDAERPSG